MAANAPFTAVTVTGIVSRDPATGFCTKVGTAVGPDAAGADTVIDLSGAFGKSVEQCSITIPHATAWYNAVYNRASAGAPATGKVTIFSGTSDVAQSTADLKGITCTWIATGYDN
jgi:hypothetical protein